MTASFQTEFVALGAALAGQFTLLREIGRGGMGVVLLARDVKLDRLVAMKVLPPALATAPETRERFLREARTSAQLAHPNIVPVYRADEVAGTAFFTMAYVDGESLADRLRERGPLPAAEAVRIVREVAWALAYAHARGVVHRDVKPENILLERGGGRVLVTDFGIAYQAEAARLTQDDHVLGTVQYMSPEQATGAGVDGRSDLYALGAVAYQLLSGRVPFDGLPAAATLVAHATRPAPPLQSVAPQVPAALAAVVDRCLAKRPDDRYPSGEALADALGRALEAEERAGGTLPDGLPPVLSEVQAAAIWQRAAQLQADALHRLESRRDLLHREAGHAAVEEVAAAEGYRVRDVAAAAVEAGISRQYVVMALAELPPDTSVVASTEVMGVSEETATRYLGTQERSLAVSLVIPAPPARTLRALGEVLQRSPYELRLRETMGAHPLDGGVMVFDLPGPIMFTSDPASQPLNTYWMATHQQFEARRVQVTMRALPSDPGRTELSMQCDLRPGVRRNVRWSKGIAGALGGTTAIATGGAIALNAALTTAAIVTIAAVPALIGGAVAAGSLALYRRSYSSTLEKGRIEMRGALEAVSAAIQSEAVFGMRPEAPVPTKAPPIWMGGV
jgi:predicted Ser/Thr protein kinase